MTRKEQSEILDDKIEVNKRQYDLDRINAEISTYSSGDLPFEKARFEYSPLGKVFIDGLDKSNRKEGLLKRLKNIEEKSNNQLLAIRDIPRPAIKGANNDGFRSDDDVNDNSRF